MGRRTPARNPFFFGDLALDEAFTDRVSELSALEQDMRNGQNVALIAPRRYGKSSLVRRASQHLVAEGVLIAEVDLMKTPTKERLASHLARAIHDDIASTTVKAREGVLRAFNALRVRPVMTYDPADATMSFSFAARQPDEDIDDTIERLLELPAELAAEEHATVVLYFDEFQQVTLIDPSLPALMRAIFQEQPGISHVYAGSKRDMMDRLFNHENEPFYRSAKVMELGPIAPGPFAGFIVERFDATDRGVSEDVVRHLLSITAGHPNATQELAHALWDEVPMGHSALPGDLDRRARGRSALRERPFHLHLGEHGASATPAPPGARHRRPGTSSRPATSTPTASPLPRPCRRPPAPLLGPSSSRATRTAPTTSPSRSFPNGSRDMQGELGRCGAGGAG